HHIWQREPEMEHLARRGRQIKHRTSYVPGMNIRADGAGQQSLIERRVCNTPGEAAGAVPDIEVHTAVNCCAHRSADPAIVAEHAFGAPMVAVGDDVATDEPVEYLLERDDR